jgi:hypothetical protein
MADASDRNLPEDPEHPGHHIDPATHIWPPGEWGPSTKRGFVSHERFARPGEQVIKRKARKRKKPFIDPHVA